MINCNGINPGSSTDILSIWYWWSWSGEFHVNWLDIMMHLI